MNRPFAVNIAISATVHALIIAALLVFSSFSCRARRPPREITTFIEIRPANPPAGAAAQVSPAPSPPAPKPDASPKPKPIEVSKRVVSRESRAPKPASTQEEIRKILAAGIQANQPVRAMDRYDEYLALVRTIMYNAWRQPPSLSAAGGLVTRARLRVMRDGRVTQREIISASGNDVMDASVTAALEAVSELPPLPTGRGSHEDITIDFELTKP